MDRVAKLRAKGKQFLVISEDEPYYAEAYLMIRKQEQEQGTWTAEDEKNWRAEMDSLEQRGLAWVCSECEQLNSKGTRFICSHCGAQEGIAHST